MMKDRAIKIWFHGVTGRMGTELVSLLKRDDQAAYRLVGGSAHRYIGIFRDGALITTPDQTLRAQLSQEKELVIIDFSSLEGNLALLDAVIEADLKETAILIGTTGLSDEVMEKWRNTSINQGLKLLFAPNTSLGILLLLRSSLALAAVCGKDFDIEMVESHHRGKVDSPSGTAKFLANQIAAKANLTPVYQRAGKRESGELGVFALRGGANPGEHTIKFMGEFEEITISHRSLSRSLFAKGALTLAGWLWQQKEGCYDLTQVELAAEAR